MGEKSDEIIDHIEEQRDKLGRNLEELENRVKRSTDWKAHFEENPTLMLGVALGGGLLLGALVGGRSESSPGYQLHTNRYSAVGDTSTGMSSPASNRAKQHAVEALDKVKAALIAFGMNKTREFLANALPGIEQHLGDFGGPVPTSTSGHPTGV